MIGKADCGKPCYAFNPILFTRCPECNQEAKEEYENGKYQKQVTEFSRINTSVIIIKQRDFLNNLIDFLPLLY